MEAPSDRVDVAIAAGVLARREQSLVERPPVDAELTWLPRRTALVVARDEVDVHAASRFREVVMHCMSCAPREMVIDLSGATSLDAAGLGVVVDAANRLGLQRVGVVWPHPLIVRVLRLAGLDRLLAVRVSGETAGGGR